MHLSGIHFCTQFAVREPNHGGDVWKVEPGRGVMPDVPRTGPQAANAVFGGNPMGFVVIVRVRREQEWPFGSCGDVVEDSSWPAGGTLTASVGWSKM